MIKRKYSILMVLSIILISLSLQSIIFVSGTKDTITDPENDVYKDFVNPSDYFDEIDIVKFEVEDQIGNQIINLTVAGNLSDWGGYITPAYKLGEVFLFENLDYDYYKANQNFTYPYYKVSYQNWTGSINFDVFFIRYLTYSSVREYWTGAGYSTDKNFAESIGNGSGSVITANISKTDFEINATTTYFARTWVTTQKLVGETIFIHFYYDYAPDHFNPYKLPGGIPGYEIGIFISSMIGLSIIIIIKQKRKTNQK